MLENGIPYLAMSYALKKIDLVEVSINRAFRGPALARMINLTSCETLLSSPAHFDPLADISGDLPHLRVLIVTAGAEDAAPASRISRSSALTACWPIATTILSAPPPIPIPLW